MKVLVLQASNDKRMDVETVSEAGFFNFIKELHHEVIVDFNPWYCNEDGEEFDVDVAVIIYDDYVE